MRIKDINNSTYNDKNDKNDDDDDDDDDDDKDEDEDEDKDKDKDKDKGKGNDKDKVNRLRAVSCFSLQSLILHAKPKHASGEAENREKRGRKPEKKK